MSRLPNEGPLSLAPAPRGRQDNPDPASTLLAKCARAFPNLSFVLRDSDACRSLTARTVADHTIARFFMPHTSVDACGKHAAALGRQSQFKLYWQLSGTIRFEDAHRSFTLSPGEMLVVPTARTYHLETGENYEGLALFFDPAASPSWWEIAHRGTEKVIGASGAIAAAAAAAAALLGHASDNRADALAVRSIIDLALCSLERSDEEAPPRLPPRLHRARLLIGQNIADTAYGPDALAKDLGVSRRSLYGIFARLGLSPAAFIKRQRLEHARDEILSDRDHHVSLSTIALESGFSDSSSFSHAFKAAYGVSPSALRARQASI